MRVVAKNKAEELRIGFAEFAGHRFLDVRVYALTHEGAKPTRKGVAVPMGSVQAFAAAVVAEIREASREAA